MAAQIVMLFGAWNLVNQRKHVLDGGAYWHKLENTIEPSGLVWFSVLPNTLDMHQCHDPSLAHSFTLGLAPTCFAVTVPTIGCLPPLVLLSWIETWIGSAVSFGFCS